MGDRRVPLKHPGRKKPRARRMGAVWGRGTSAWGPAPRIGGMWTEEQRAGAQQQRAPRTRGAVVSEGRGGPQGAPGEHVRRAAVPLPQRWGPRKQGEAGGRRAHPQGGQVDVVQAAGGGWVAHGLRGKRGPGAAHAPARLFRCRRRRFSPHRGSGGWTPARLPQRTARGRATGAPSRRLTGAVAAAPAAEPPARAAQAPSG